MTDRQTRPGKFIWFELVTREPKRAQSFYAELLGWKVQPFPMGASSYDMIYLGDTMIGGFVDDADCPRAHWTSYVSVADVDASVKAATANGGHVIEGAHDIPRAGRRALIADPQGAALGLFKNVAGDPPDAPAPNGGFLWVELHTPDPVKALAFYGKVVGFTHEAMDMGPGGTYHVLSASGAGRGGVTPFLPQGVPPHWLPYVCVGDPDAASARAKKTGGKILMNPETIPTVGRISVLEDPTGAALALLKPMPTEKPSR